MKLPTCWSCHYSYRYSESVKYLFIKKCPKCGEQQYLTTKSNLKTGVPAMVIMFLPTLLISVFLDLSFASYIAIVIILFIITLLTLPFSLQFTNKKEPLF
ncbi:hypothetical protein N0O92_08255 [Alkalihalobacillus sp. MEB130]|uniref:TIGR04104 family putative zinc finger protein n=1 Tax=Alkalihalobacillus sp. MEB130 TaxID=2976704 RepID=UPI0028DF095E|nr:TIGR04104 family putative zinc finger protein [Alkalihalobacillus sp. MEB130]MDT8860224.1 hypothetical protein [Alkalihalobacillus sp. MEB130]